MSESYSWVNVDKKEYICPYIFDFGCRQGESLVRGNEFLAALYSLLSKEWAGDHILWMGENSFISENEDNETLRILYGHMVQTGYPDYPFDTMCESFKNVSGLFKIAEEVVREEIFFYIEDCQSDEPFLVNEYGIDIEKPYEGLFMRDGQNFRYIVNHTRKVCYSFDKTKILHQDNTESDVFDPLPILMTYGGNAGTGMWVGDVIGVANEIPEGYELLKSVYLDW